MNFYERDLYTGLAAVHWSTISVTDPRVDQAFYRQIIQRNRGKALELGCGAGRLLLAYLKEGLDVEGVDISSDMLAVCRKAAEADGLHPVLYEQQMQCLNLPHRFNTIYISCGSFVCVMDRAAALQTLQRCHVHLNPGGELAFNLDPANRYYFQDEPDQVFPKEWRRLADKQLPDGRRLLVYHRKVWEDAVEQLKMQERRYELYEGDRLVQEEIHASKTRWYHRNELLWMLQLAGFSNVVVKGDFTGEDLNANHKENMVFVATKDADA